MIYSTRECYDRTGYNTSTNSENKANINSLPELQTVYPVATKTEKWPAVQLD